MLSRFSDFDRTFELLDAFRRQVERGWEVDRGARFADRPPQAFPRVNVLDAGEHVVVQADVLGLTDKDVELTLHDGVLTLAGARKLEIPEGYRAHMQERAGYRFSRSLALPCKVDAERTTATVNDGVLTVTLAKAVTAKPRQIAIKAQA